MKVKEYNDVITALSEYGISYRALASEFGCSPALICLVLNGKARDRKNIVSRCLNKIEQAQDAQAQIDCQVAEIAV